MIYESSDHLVIIVQSQIIRFKCRRTDEREIHSFQGFIFSARLWKLKIGLTEEKPHPKTSIAIDTKLRFIINVR